MQTNPQVYRTILLGIVTGFRATGGIAALSRAAVPDRSPDGTGRLPACRGVARALTIAAAGEVVADKLPFLGSRTLPRLPEE
ncbi:MAG: hypothetical protein ACRDFX_05795 [Chloroflexota bacterium]